MNKLGREQPSVVEFDNIGFMYCDGIVIDNVKSLLIDYCDDEIILKNKKGYEVGIIHEIGKRVMCIFTKECENYEYKDYNIIINGKVVI